MSEDHKIIDDMEGVQDDKKDFDDSIPDADEENEEVEQDE